MIERDAVDREKALLVGVIRPGLTETTIHEHLNELELLADTAGAEVVGRITQKISRINPSLFLGKGKAEKMINQAQELDVKLILFDDELSPAQIKNYHKLSDKIKVLDRSGLILDIFQKHGLADGRTYPTNAVLTKIIIVNLWCRKWIQFYRRSVLADVQTAIDQ